MRSDDELLAAYCDGVTELSTDERKRIEALLADSASLRADETATRQLLGALRELPPEGSEPDWSALERAIRSEVGAAVPRVWWRPLWRWLVPAAALASIAVIALLAVPDDADAPVAPPVTVHPTPPVPEPEVAVILDGEELVLEESDAEAFDVDAALLGEDTGAWTSEGLAWVDELDDASAAIVDRWLDERKKG